MNDDDKKTIWFWAVALLVPAFFVLLAGCGFTPQGDAVREFIELRAQKTADQSAVNARKYLCEYARVGSISKLFPGEDGRKAYLKFCEKRGPVIP